MKNKVLVFVILVLIIFIVEACSKLAPSLIADDNTLDGPIEGLTHAQNNRHLKGDIAFNDEVFTPQTGLGSIFVATSCGSCHAGDGKGHPFTTLTRFGQTDETGNKFLHLGGPQLQNRALPGYTPEKIPDGATFSNFLPPINSGLGLIEAVSDATILAMEDPFDADSDGISGVANWSALPSYITPPANAIEKNGKYIHRFGKKGSAFNLLHQTVNAYNQDMGITSVFDPKDVFSLQEIDPEVSTQTVNDVVFYLQTLKAPIQRNKDNEQVKNGKNIFMQIDCGKCHTPSLTTDYSAIEPLSYKTFYPYSDLLLHDMGSGLDDGYTEGSAKTYEWRTPPLWGLGLSPNSQGGKYFLMHDGRAKTIEEAILMHDGEAKNSKEKYIQLSQADKENMIQFLKSL